jgi:hypothetical protein
MRLPEIVPATDHGRQGAAAWLHRLADVGIVEQLADNPRRPWRLTPHGVRLADACRFTLADVTQGPTPRQRSQLDRQVQTAAARRDADERTAGWSPGMSSRTTG